MRSGRKVADSAALHGQVSFGATQLVLTLTPTLTLTLTLTARSPSGLCSSCSARSPTSTVAGGYSWSLGGYSNPKGFRHIYWSSPREPP